MIRLADRMMGEARLLVAPPRHRRTIYHDLAEWFDEIEAGDTDES